MPRHSNTYQFFDGGKLLLTQLQKDRARDGNEKLRTHNIMKNLCKFKSHLFSREQHNTHRANRLILTNTQLRS